MDENRSCGPRNVLGNQVRLGGRLFGGKKFYGLLFRVLSHKGFTVTGAGMDDEGLGLNGLECLGWSCDLSVSCSEVAVLVGFDPIRPSQPRRLDLQNGG